MFQITFTNKGTGEYQFVEYQLRAIRSKPEGLIKLKTHLRKTVAYHLTMINPMRKETTIELHSNLDELIYPPEYNLPAQSKVC